MAKAWIPVALITIAAGGYIYYGKAKAAEGLQFYPKSFKFTGGLLAPKLIYIMDIVNASEKTLQLNNIFGNVYIGEKMIGRIEYQQKTFFKTGTTTVGVPCILFSGGVVEAIVNLITGKGAATLKILGTVNAEGFQTPLNEDIPLA